MKLLVVGSGGLLGHAAVGWCDAHGVGCHRASHRPGADMTLDLHHPPGAWADNLPDGLTHALLCSAISRLDTCAREPEATWRFNVTHTLALIESLAARGIVPVFCSSDLVFAGQRGGWREDDACHPTTAYGRQKRAVEEHLARASYPWLVLRLSKLYSDRVDDPSPVCGILRDLLAGRIVRGAVDQTVCPTWVDDVPRALGALLQADATGVWHVACAERYTRHSLALLLAEAVGRPELVQPCHLADFDFVEPRPADNTLDVGRLTGLGVVLTPLREKLPAILENHRHGRT